MNFKRVSAACILILKFELFSNALNKGFILFAENSISDLSNVGFSRIFAMATHEFQAILGFLLSKLSIIIWKMESKDKFESESFCN